MRRPATKRTAAFALGASSLLAVSCGLVAPIPEPDDIEQTLAQCSDGLDNDLDGTEDCEDPSCECDACLPPQRRRTEGDVLGVACTDSCQCRYAAPGARPEANLQVCNLNAWVGGNAQAGRCSPVSTLSDAGTPAADENSFSVSFILERGSDGASEPVSHRQNVVGISRFQGQSLALSSAVWSRQRFSFCEGSCVRGDFALEVVLTAPLVIDDGTTVALIDDGIVATRSGIAVRSQLGPFTGNVEDEPGINQLAVIESATLSVSMLEGRPDLLVGRFDGRLRPSGAIDRAQGGSCPLGALFHPDQPDCFPPVRLGANAFFTFGCLLDPAAPPTSGLAVYAWNHPWSTLNEVAVRTSGRCVAARAPAGVEVRLAASLLDFPGAVIEMWIPSEVLAPGTTRPVGPDQPIQATVYQVPTEGRRLFDLDLSAAADSRVFTIGRIGLEQVNSGAPSRLFGWLEGVFE